MDTYVQIGLITRPHGLRGEVCVISYADSPFLMQGQIFLQAPGGPCVPYTVQGTRRHRGVDLLLLEGVLDRTAAEKLRQHKVCVPRQMLPPLDTDELYMEDLLGATVILHEENSLLGTLHGFQSPTPEQEIWVIRTPDGKEVLFPAVEEFINNVDLDTRSIRISPPPGLLDIYLSDT